MTASQEESEFPLQRRPFMKTLQVLTVMWLSNEIPNGIWSFLGRVSEDIEEHYDPMLDDLTDLLNGTTTDLAYQEGRYYETISDGFQNGFVDKFPFFESDPAFIQGRCPSEYLVSHWNSDFKALFSEEGKMTAIHRDTHKMPFSGEETLEPGFMTDGAFGGVFTQESEGGWFFEDFDTEETEIEDGVYTHVYESDDLRVEREAYVPPGSGQVNLDFRLENKSSEKIEGDFLFYSMINANDNHQNGLLFNSEVNELIIDNDKVKRIAESSEDEIEVRLEGAESSAIGRPAIDEEVREKAMEQLDYEIKNTIENYIPVPGVDDILVNSELPLFVADLPDALEKEGIPFLMEIADYVVSDRFKEVISDEEEDLSDGTTFDELIDQLEEDEKEQIRARYGASVQSRSLELEEEEVEVSVQIGEELERGSAGNSAKSWELWKESLDTGNIDEEYRETVERMAENAWRMFNPSYNLNTATPNIQPSWTMVWPRDHHYFSVFAAHLGEDGTAVDSVKRALETTTEYDYGEQPVKVRQSYSLEGEYKGFIGEENDQYAFLINSVYDVRDITGREFLDEMAGGRKVREYVEDLADTIVSKITESGLIEFSQDYKEYPTDYTTSVWTNFHSIKALRNVTEDDSIERDYSEEIREIEEGVRNWLDVDGDGRWYRYLSPFNAEEDKNGMSSVMIYEGQVEGDKYIDEIREGVQEREERWMVSELETARALYSMGKIQKGDEIVECVIEKKEENHGVVPERIQEDGEFSHSSHLVWAQCALGIALYEREQAKENLYERV